MNKIFKFTYLVIALAAFGFVACKDAQPEVDTTLRDEVVASRGTLTVADAYSHGDAYQTGDASYKLTTTLMSEGMSLAYDEDGTFSGYEGTGFVFEIEFNSASETSLPAGKYVADALDVNDEYERAPLTINPENTYLKIVHNGSATQQDLTDIVVTVSGTAPNYTIQITAKNAMDVEVSGTFTGKIEFLDIYFWREPLTAQTVTIKPTTFTHAASSSNVYYCSRYAVELFTITVDCEGGDVLVLSFEAGTTGKTSADYLETLPSGTYKTTDSSLDAGYWDVYDSSNKYDVAIADYRSEPEFAGSYLLAADGSVYYLADAVAVVEMEGAIVKKLSLDATSAYGTAISIDYTAE